MTRRQSDRMMRNGIGALMCVGAVAVGALLWASYDPCPLMNMLGIYSEQCFVW